MKNRRSPAAMITATMLLLIAFVFASSCGSFHFRKINPYNDFTSDHLHARDVKKIRIIYPDSISIYPGSSFPIGVIAVTSTHKELKTRGFANGFVNWNSYAVRVEGGSFDKEKGIVTVNYDPRTIANHFKIIVTPYYFPELKQEIEVPISYKTKFVAYCKGQNGSGGFNGLSGRELHLLDGTSHTYSNGYNGQNGTDGETASDGCLVDVFAKAIIAGDRKMMSVLVINHCDNAHSVFWIDPDGGSLLVDARGGDGGDGGDGGNGEAGTNGIMPAGFHPAVIHFVHVPHAGWCDPGFCRSGYYFNPYSGPPVDSLYKTVGTNGGIGGNGGNAGYGGNGGVVVVHLDSSAVQWKNKILVENSGGKAGKPGAGGYAGAGGRGVPIDGISINGKTGYIGVTGIKAKNGKLGGETEWRVENMKMKW